MIYAAPAVLVKSLHDSFHALTGVAIASRFFEPKRKSPLAIFLLQSTSSPGRKPRVTDPTDSMSPSGPTEGSRLPLPLAPRTCSPLLPEPGAYARGYYLSHLRRSLKAASRIVWLCSLVTISVLR